MLMGINSRPSPRDLKSFGVVILVFFGMIGVLVRWRTGSLVAPTILWSTGAALCLVYYSVRPLRRPLYLLWMYVLSPISRTIPLLLLAAVYYLVLTPIGLTVRMFGQDPMRRRFEPTARTYWVEHRTGGDPSRYLRQF